MIGCADIGYPRTKMQVLSLVESVLCRKKGVEESVVSSGWWESFKKRHPKLSLISTTFTSKSFINIKGDSRSVFRLARSYTS